MFQSIVSPNDLDVKLSELAEVRRFLATADDAMHLLQEAARLVGDNDIDGLIDLISVHVDGRQRIDVGLYNPITALISIQEESNVH